MDNPAIELRPRAPLNVCPACGGDWFREVNSYEFQREETLGYFWPTWPTWPALVGQLSKGVMPLLVCLCGSPLAPRIGSVRGGGTFNSELVALLDSLRKVLDRLEDIRSDRSILAGLAGQPASPEAFDALATRLENVERVLAQRIRRPSAAGSGDRRRESRGPKHREAAEPQTIINRISATLVNREEYERLAEQIADFETILQLRLPDSTPSPDSPPPGNGP